MNIHDQKRIDQVKRTLTKAKYELEVVRLYLHAGEQPDLVVIADMHELEDTIDNVLDKLGSVVIRDGT